MGPLLFIMNEMICKISNFYTRSCTLKAKEFNNVIQSITDLLSTWLKSNKLTLITHKTFFQLFHRAIMKTNNSVNIIVDKCVLDKYLGIIIDHKLNWIEHISYVKQNVKRHWNNI